MQDQPIRGRRKLFTAALAAITMITASAVVAGASPRTEVSLTDATASPAGVFVSVSPLRVLDTRPAPLLTGVPVAAPLGAGQTMTLQLAGDGKAIPATATSAMLNVTIDQDAPVQSFLTIWPTGEAQPLTSANNALPGLVASNSMVAKLGTGGSISIFNQQGAVNVVIDLVGYLVPLAGAAAAAGARGAAGAFSTTPVLVTPTGTTPQPIAFLTAGPAGGSVAITSTTTFTVSVTGLYSIDYHLNLSVAAVGSISVFVNGAAQGPASVLAAGVTGVANTVLVTAVAGNPIQLEFTPTVGGATLSLTNSSIVLEQATPA